MNAEQASASLERRYTALSEEHSKARSLPPSQRRDAFPPSLLQRINPKARPPAAGGVRA